MSTTTEQPLPTHELARLRVLARTVAVSQPGQLTARGAASALRGAVRLVANAHGTPQMRRACASLALAGAWDVAAMRDHDQIILASMAEGVATVAGRDNTVAALAFWASETDPNVWMDVAAA